MKKRNLFLDIFTSTSQLFNVFESLYYKYYGVFEIKKLRYHDKIVCKRFKNKMTQKNS